MSLHDWLTTADIQGVFAEEIRAAGGTILETFDDGRRLFVRSLLPRLEEVRPHDKVQGGVALRATEGEVWVHPYVFRLVCRNGAIRAHALASRHVAADDFITIEEAGGAVREAVQACCANEVFATGANEMRSAQVGEIDAILNLMPLLGHLPAGSRNQMIDSILAQFEAGSDRSRFGLMNAVTATARDVPDPELRWRLEEFGGGIPATLPTDPRDHGAAEALCHRANERTVTIAG
jgi:hypothetical protein